PLGSTFNVAKGDSGIPSFMSGGYLEAAYIPDFKHGPTFDAKLSKVNDKCVLGFCNDERRINACKLRREYGTIINKEFDFGPQIEEIEEEDNKEKRTYYIPIGTRMSYLRLFQKINTKQTNIELHD
ncbi:30049_t:CDS:2, partial [Gigaspora margarita]